MASPTKDRDRLDAIDREIDMLDARLVHEEQEAHGLIAADEQDEKTYEILEAQAFMTRQRIAMLLRQHRELARKLLKDQCPAHGDAILVSCPDCAERNPAIRANHAAYVVAARAEGRAA